MKMNTKWNTLFQPGICLLTVFVLILGCSGCKTTYEPLPDIPQYPENTRTYKTGSTIEYLPCGNPDLDRMLRDEFEGKQYKNITNGTYYKGVIPQVVHIFRVLDFTTTLHKRPEGLYLHSRLIVMIRPPGILFDGSLVYEKSRYFQAYSRMFMGTEDITAEDYRSGMSEAVKNLFRIHEFRSALEGEPVRRNAPIADMKNADSLWRRSFYYQSLGLHEYFEAVRWAYLAAKAGNRQAQRYIAARAMNTNYFGDVKRHLKLITFLAYSGAPEAQLKLGSMYRFGQGVPENAQEAVRWYKSAADQKYAPAQFVLGTCFESGYGVPQDISQAISYLRAAAQSNYAPAVKRLQAIMERMKQK